MSAPAEAQAREFHLEMVEVLKLLNRCEEEHGESDGLEHDEVVHLLGKAGFPNADLAETGRTLDVLLANGLARRLTTTAYAWDRGRVVGDRYAFTLDGKRLLLKEIVRVGRI